MSKAIGGIDASLKQRKGDPVQAELDSAMKRIGELTMQVERAGGQDGDLRPFGAAEVAAMSAATSPGTGLAYGLTAGLRRLGHGPLLVLRHDLRPARRATSRQSVGDRTPAISDQALLVAIEADLEASPWEGEGYSQGLGSASGSVATSGLPASGCSA